MFRYTRLSRDNSTSRFNSDSLIVVQTEVKFGYPIIFSFNHGSIISANTELHNGNTVITLTQSTQSLKRVLSKIIVPGDNLLRVIYHSQFNNKFDRTYYLSSDGNIYTTDDPYQPIGGPTGLITHAIHFDRFIIVYDDTETQIGTYDMISHNWLEEDIIIPYADIYIDNKLYSIDKLTSVEDIIDSCNNSSSDISNDVIIEVNNSRIFYSPSIAIVNNDRGIENTEGNMIPVNSDFYYRVDDNGNTLLVYNDEGILLDSVIFDPNLNVTLIEPYVRIGDTLYTYNGNYIEKLDATIFPTEFPIISIIEYPHWYQILVTCNNLYTS